MVRRKLVVLFVSALIAGLAPLAMAGIPDLDNSSASTAAGATQVSVYTLPSGNGRGLDEARALGVGVVDATITLTLNDGNGDPIYLYPSEDMWLETSLGNLKLCAGGSAANFSTNAAGQTTWVNPIRGGDQSDKVGLEKTVVVISGSSLTNSPLDILWNSPDIDGNLTVNLTDTVFYATDATGAYAYRSDFYYDGAINLSDTVLYAQGLGAACP